MCGFTNCLAQGASQEQSGKEQEPAPNGGQGGKVARWQGGRQVATFRRLDCPLEKDSAQRAWWGDPCSCRTTANTWSTL